MDSPLVDTQSQSRAHTKRICDALRGVFLIGFLLSTAIQNVYLPQLVSEEPARRFLQRIGVSFLLVGPWLMEAFLLVSGYSDASELSSSILHSGPRLSRRVVTSAVFKRLLYIILPTYASLLIWAIANKGVKLSESLAVVFMVGDFRSWDRSLMSFFFLPALEVHCFLILTLLFLAVRRRSVRALRTTLILLTLASLGSRLAVTDIWNISSASGVDAERYNLIFDLLFINPITRLYGYLAGVLMYSYLGSRPEPLKPRSTLCRVRDGLVALLFVVSCIAIMTPFRVSPLMETNPFASGTLYFLALSLGPPLFSVCVAVLFYLMLRGPSSTQRWARHVAGKSFWCIWGVHGSVVVALSDGGARGDIKWSIRTLVVWTVAVVTLCLISGLLLNIPMAAICRSLLRLRKRRARLLLSPMRF